MNDQNSAEPITSSTPLVPKPGLNYRKELRDVVLATSLMALSVAPFIAAAYHTWPSDPIPLHALTIAIGAAGWLIALALRVPISLLAKALHLSTPAIQSITIWSSGPCEETIRVIFLYFIPGNATFARAWSLGVGWTSIEIVYSIVQAWAGLQLRHSDSPKAREARDKISELYGEDFLNQQYGWWWGPIERVSGSMIHLGFTLWELVNPFAFLPAAVVHSAINAAAVAGLKRIGVAGTEIGIWMAATGIFVGSLLALNRL